MSGRYLLDSNIIIALFAREAAVLEQLTQAELVLLPSIAVGELYYGARKSARAADNIANLDALVASVPVLACDTRVARRYGEIKDQLRRRGKPIPENDIWIAAVAIEHGLTLVTRDAHMSQIASLSVEAW